MIIAIDGPAGAGKTTISGLLAGAMSGRCPDRAFRRLDTGAFYRALAVAELDLSNIGKGHNLDLDSVQLMGMFIGEEQRMYALGRRIQESELRDPHIGGAASVISAQPAVREYVNRAIRRLAADGDVVAEGRDTGSVLFPDAGAKFYLDADPDIRAARRAKDLGPAADPSLVKASMQARDARDSSRAAAPLKIPDGAVYVDNSYRTPEETAGFMAAVAARLLGL